MRSALFLIGAIALIAAWLYTRVPSAPTHAPTHNPMDAHRMQSEARLAARKLQAAQTQIAVFTEQIRDISQIVNGQMTDTTLKDWQAISQKGMRMAAQYAAIGRRLSTTITRFSLWSEHTEALLPRPKETPTEAWERLRKELPYLRDRIRLLKESHEQTMIAIEASLDLNTELCRDVANTSLVYQRLYDDAQEGWTLKKMALSYGAALACIVPGKLLEGYVGTAVVMAGSVAVPMPALAFGAPVILGVTTAGVAGYQLYDKFVVRPAMQRDYLTMLDKVDTAAAVLELTKVYSATVNAKLEQIVGLGEQLQGDAEAYEQNALHVFFEGARRALAEINAKHDEIMLERVGDPPRLGSGE